MVRRLTAATLAAALVILSPGLDAGRAFAAVVTGRVSVPAVSGVGASGAAAVPATTLSLGAVSLAAPSLSPLPHLVAAPAVVSPAADAPAPAASVPAMAEALAPALEAAADAEAGAAADRGNAQHIEDVITGRRSIAGSGDAAVAGGLSAGPAALSAPADAPAAAPKGAPEAPKAPAVKVVSSRLAYAWHRMMLSMVASLTGAVHSMPAAGPALTERAIKAAADRRVVISDFDDTLAAYNQTLSPEMIEAIRQVRAAGKDFAVISDRGDEKRAHQLTVFESLATLPVELRAGMYVAANSGGRVYRYDEKGEPVKLFEVPALTDERKAIVSQAAEATKERMKALGAEQHDPVKSGNNNPSESWNTYGYAMMLKVGSSEKQVRGAAEIMQEELAKRGIEAEVNPRFAKDPANPPYINFSIVTKQPATEYIAKALKASAGEVVLVGDSMYVPHEAKTEGSRLDKLGERLAGRKMPKTGNATDRNMEKALPGALVIAVGHNADPRMSNAWVTDVKGPESTRRMLLSVASKPLPGWGGYHGQVALEKARLKSLHQGAALSIPGARGVEVEALQPYGLGHDSFSVDVLFDDIEAARRAAREGLLPKALPDAADGSKVIMVWSLAEGTEESFYAAYEQDLKRDFAALPGAAGVELKEYQAYGMGVTDRVLTVYFKDEAGLAAAREAGMLPARLAVNEELPNLRRVYEVRAEVGVAPAAEAAGRAGLSRPGDTRNATLSVLAAVALAVAGMAGLVALANAVADIMVQGEQLLRQHYMDPFDGAFLLGGAGLLLGSLKTGKRDGEGEKKSEDPAKKVNEDKPLSRGEKIAAAILLPAAVVGALFMWYLIYAGFGTLPTSSPVDVPPGWQGPIPNIRGIEDLFGAGLGFLGMAGILGWGKKKPAAPSRREQELAAHEKTLTERMRGIAGVRAASTRATMTGDSYNGSYPSLDERDLVVEFESLAALLAARRGGLIPARRDAWFDGHLDGAPELGVRRYNFAPVVLNAAAELEALENGLRERFGAVAGVKAVSIAATMTGDPYNGSYPSFDERDLVVEFESLAALQAARGAGLVPARRDAHFDGSLDGVPELGVRRYNFTPVLLNAEAEIAARENGLRERFGAVAGVKAVSIAATMTGDPYNGSYPSRDERDVRVEFESLAALEAAKRDGALPAPRDEHRPAELEGIPELGIRRYNLVPAIHEPAPAAEPARAWSGLKSFAAWLGLAALTAAVYGGFYWAFSHAPAATPEFPTAPAGWESLFQMGAAGLGLAGLAGMIGRPQLLENPGQSYAQALKKATEIAAARGVPSEKVLFVQATSVMPLHESRHWSYEFALPRQDGGHDVVYVDFDRYFGGPADMRASLYEKVGSLADGAVPMHLSVYALASRGTQVNPEAALDLVRKQVPGFGSRVSVTLRLEQTEDLDPWYRFYDEKGGEAAVNARTGEARVARAPDAPASRSLPTLGQALLLLAVLATLAYVMVSGQLHFLAGAALGLGAIKKIRGGKAKLTDADVRATASYVISYKGRPWSQTEFNSVYYPALEGLKSKGATKRQLALFEKLVADAPVKGGSFNPWSGD